MSAQTPGNRSQQTAREATARPGRRGHPPAVRTAAVSALLTGSTTRQVAAALGISRSTALRWRAEQVTPLWREMASVLDEPAPARDQAPTNRAELAEFTASLKSKSALELAEMARGLPL